MLTLITDPKATDLLEKRFQREMDAFATDKRPARITWRPRTIEVDVMWSEPLGIWWYAEELENRWWNVFGFEYPTGNAASRIACEINFSRRGLNRGIAGLLLQVGREVFVAHRGNHVGGGKPGITKELFWASRPAENVEFIDSAGDRSAELARAALVTRLGDAQLGRQVAAFIRWVAEFKGLVNNGGGLNPNPNGPGGFFSPEFEGERLPVSGADYVANVNHGRLVRELRDQLGQLGVQTANTIRWDLYVPSAGGI